jgi:DNA-binding PadR family transcriptional regulator
MNRYDLIILGLLEDKPQHGYDIKTFVESTEMNRWANISVSSLYNRLSWLEKHGYIYGTEQQVGNRPVRNEFRMTEAGKELLKQEVKDFIGGFNDDPRTLGLAFLHVLPNDLAQAYVQEHIEDLQQEVKNQKSIIRKKKAANPLLNSLSPILSNMSLEHIRVELKFMKAVLEVLQDPEKVRHLKNIFDING